MNIGEKIKKPQTGTGTPEPGGISFQEPADILISFIENFPSSAWMSWNCPLITTQEGVSSVVAAKIVFALSKKGAYL